MSLHVTRTARPVGTAILLLGLFAGGVGAQNATTSAPSRTVSSTSAPASTLKELDPADLAFWKNIRFTTLSNDGKWFAYQLTPNEGDAEVIVRPTAEGAERRFAIG